jgi:hypothetical protein
MSHIDGVDDGVGYGGIYYKTTIHTRGWRAIFVRQMIRYIRISLQDDLTIVPTASILDCRTISQYMISKTLVTMDYARKFLAMICEEQSYRKR